MRIIANGHQPFSIIVNHNGLEGLLGHYWLTRSTYYYNNDPNNGESNDGQ